MKTEADGYKWETVTPKIPDEARLHPLWHLDEDPDRNARILAAHPPFMGFNLVNRAKPRHTCWPGTKAVHAADCRPAYGRGRSMAFLSDAAGAGASAIRPNGARASTTTVTNRRFWVNAVRWLAENSLSAHRTRLLVSTEAVNYLPGETIRLQARKLGLTTAGDLRGWKVRAELAGNPGARTALELDEQHSVFVGSLVLPEDRPAVEGVVRFVAEGPRGTTPDNAEVSIRVLPAGREMADPTPDPQTLQQLAERTGGEVITTPGPLTARLRPAAVAASGGGRLFNVPLWDRTWLWFLITALLSAECSCARPRCSVAPEPRPGGTRKPTVAGPRAPSDVQLRRPATSAMVQYRR